MKRYGENHHQSPVQFHFRSFCLIRLIDAPVQMRDHMIQEKQEQDPQPEPDKSRKKCPSAFLCRLIDGGDDQAPDRCCHHHACREPGQGTLCIGLKVPFQEEYAGRTGCCTDKGDQKPTDYRFHLRSNSPFLFQSPINVDPGLSAFQFSLHARCKPLRFYSILRNGPDMSKAFAARYSPIQYILIHPAYRDTPFLGCLLN